MAEKDENFSHFKYFSGNNKAENQTPGKGQEASTYRKSMRSAISDVSTGVDSCEFFPKTSAIVLKSNARV